MNKRTLEQAQQHFQAKRWDEALAAYQSLLEATPDDAYLWHALAIVHSQLRDFSAAEQAIQQAIQLSPTEAALYNSLGNILISQERWEPAVQALETALKLTENYAIAWNNLGRCYYQQAEWTLAEQAYQKAITINPKFFDAHYNLGLLYSRRDQLDSAITVLNTALSLRPDSTAVSLLLSSLYLQQDHTDQAIMILTTIIEREPNQIDALYSLGQAYLQKKNYDDAIACLKKTLILDSGHLDCQFDLANAYLATGDYAKALNYYLRQLEVKPMTEAYYNIGVIFMHQDRHQDALRYLQQAAILDPDSPAIYINLGSLYLKMERRADAIAAYQNAQKLRPDDAEINYILTALQDSAIAPDRAPDEYIAHLFDQYAPYYEQHLTGQLHYHVPESIHTILLRDLGDKKHGLTILDLGCGTGLMGEYLKPYANQLTGVDLSSDMINIAESKEIYDQLIISELSDYLRNSDSAVWNLIIAADVFSYFGDLDTIFQLVSAVLKPSGRFVFTVEKNHGDNFILQSTMRYAHSKAYITTLAERYGFVISDIDNLVLRQQRKQPIEGYLVVLQK